MKIGYISNDNLKLKHWFSCPFGMKRHYATATQGKLLNACKNMQPGVTFLSRDDWLTN